jgi:hypothetical protein
VDAMTPPGIFPPRVHRQSVAAMVEVAWMESGMPADEIPVNRPGYDNPVFRSECELSGSFG